MNPADSTPPVRSAIRNPARSTGRCWKPTGRPPSPTAAAHRQRRVRHPAGPRRDVHPAAPAAGLVQVVLVTPGRLRLGDVLLLIGPGNAQVSGVRQVSAALAVSPREVIDRLVSPAPAHRGARRPWLLARLPLPLRPLRGAPVLPRRQLPPGQVITARRHRRVPRVPRDGPQRRVQLLTQFHGQRCQRRDPLILPRGQLIVQCDPHSQLIDLRRLLTDQRSRGSSTSTRSRTHHPRNHAQPPCNATPAAKP